MNEFFKKPIVKILMLKGEKGDKGDTGTGTPTGGKTGQYLQKKTDADYDYMWSDITTVPWDDVTGKPEATTSSAGLMSAEDKTALDGLKNDGPMVLKSMGRLSSANVNYSDAKLRFILSSSNMYEGKPCDDGFILSFSWDSGNFDSQLYIPGSTNNNLRPIQFRYICNGVWTDWISIYSENNHQKSTEKSFTLSASGWVLYNGYYKYDISDSLVTATSNQEVVPSHSITREQLKALQKANLVGTQDYGNMYLWVYGTLPTIDIPIQVIFRGTI